MNEIEMKARIAELEAKLAEVQQGVPEGWKLVPIEPTEGIEHAAADYLGECVKAHGLWLAMLVAAPKPPATHPTQQGLDAGNADANRLIGRLLSSDPDFEDCTEAANLIRELTQNGPDGFATWKDAAVSERVLRVDMQRVIRALPRVTYGYKSDGEVRYLTSYESSEGQFLRHADVMAAIAAQAKQGGV